MLRSGMLVGAVLFASLLGTSCEGVVVRARIAPPPPIIETYGSAPGPGYVWQQGYQRWDGRGYAWSPGRWVRAPRGRARWEPDHWEQRRGQWVLIRGRWR
ncbi:MAG: YXWGXW repeat-containing protein [Acidobacteriota bacterium]